MQSTDNIRRINVFISSPSDVTSERDAVLRAIERLNRLSYIRDRFVLSPLRYETDVPPEMGTPAQVIVDRYMAVEQSQLVICILWMRMGTPFVHPQTGERFISGTAYELAVGYRSQKEKGIPHILLYRKVATNPDADLAQAALVEQFFKGLQSDEAEFQGLYKTFTSAEEFEQLVFEHIDRVLASPAFADSTLQRSPPNRLVEEERRLDVAMPNLTTIGQPTEVWAQICLLKSSGFRHKLPHHTSESEVIGRDDVRDNTFNVTFPVDKQTNALTPIGVSVELRASDFNIDDPIKHVLLSSSMDSGLLIFSLHPKTLRKRSIVHVLVKQKLANGAVIELGGTAISTEIRSSVVGWVSQAVWAVVGLPAAIVTLTMPTVVPDAEKQEEISQYLYLDTELLYALLPGYTDEHKKTNFDQRGQMKAGEEIFQVMRPQLERVLCPRICQHLDSASYDDIQWVLVIERWLIELAFESSIPATLLAALVVKHGVGTFCRCNGEGTP